MINCKEGGNKMKKGVIVILFSFIIILAINSVSYAADEDVPRVCEFIETVT